MQLEQVELIGINNVGEYAATTHSDDAEEDTATFNEHDVGICVFLNTTIRGFSGNLKLRSLSIKISKREMLNGGVRVEFGFTIVGF